MPHLEALAGKPSNKSFLHHWLVGHFCGEHSKARHWLTALNKAVNRQFPTGIQEMEIELNLMSDNGSQPTSRRLCKPVRD
jgi:hypothetical protein